MSIRDFLDAAAATTAPGTITAAQTSIVCVSTANFENPAANHQFSIGIFDAGNPLWNPNSPLATPFEYQPILAGGNNVGTNTLTLNGGTRTGYAGTTPHAYFAGAIIAAVLLAEDLTAAFARIDQANALPFTAAGLTSTAKYFSSGSLPALGALASGIATQSNAGNDTAGIFNLLTSGSPPGLGATIASLTFTTPYPAIPTVLLTLNNTTQVGSFACNVSTTGFNLQTNQAMAANTTYIIGYFVIGR